MNAVDKTGFSRRRFLRDSGLVVAFSFAQPLTALAGEGPPAGGGQRRTIMIDSWLRISPDGKVTIFTGKVELGQGIKTALIQIAAEELDVDLSRMSIITADTVGVPNENRTAGSNSIEASGATLRQVAADTRKILLEMAAAKLKAAPEDFDIADGRMQVRGTDRGISYWELVTGETLAREADGSGKKKDPKDYKFVGKSIPRIDIPNKVFGLPAFVQDMRLPGMLHGRVVRPPGYGSTLRRFDDAAITAMPGVVAVVRDGSFLGVVTEREEQAIKAADAIRAAAQWDETPVRPIQGDIFNWLLSSKSIDKMVVEGRQTDDPIPDLLAPDGAAKVVSATYTKPYLMHGSIGPSAAVAQMVDGKYTVWTSTQGVFPLRNTIALVLDMKPEDIRCIHVEGSACYGHNGADDVSLDAVLLARAVPDRPVRVQWMRDDEHGWEPYGPAMVLRMQGSIDSSGTVTAWNNDFWTTTHTTRPDGGREKPSAYLTAAWHIEKSWPMLPGPPNAGHQQGEHRNGEPLYTFAGKRTVKHYVQELPVRTSSTRGLGAYAQSFAIESFVDELAHAAGADPVEFRLKHLADERAKAVIRLAAEKANWTPGQTGGQGKGRGFAFSQYENEKGYVAMVVDVDVNRVTGAVKLERVVMAGEAGCLISPDGVANQYEGGVVQSASWTMKEQVSFDPLHITSLDWASYPILTFPEAPEIETHLIDRPDLPAVGAGEVTQGPTPAAIANAIFHATGIRLRDTPFTPDKVRAALS